MVGGQSNRCASGAFVKIIKGRGAEPGGIMDNG